jgi:hypothetical protein
MPDNSISVFGELSKPATVLVEKISEALGGAFRPFQIKRVAVAEAEAQIIRAEAEIQVTDLHRRAAGRFLNEEARKQANIESIATKAMPLLEEHAEPQRVEADWIANFFDKCRIISDDEMQRLWSKILAGEANSPGTFSRRTVNLIGDLEKSDAALFNQLCSFCWEMVGTKHALVFETENAIYTARGINYGALAHLQSLGLIQVAGVGSFSLTSLWKRIHLFYFGRVAEITNSKESDNVLEVGKVLLTKSGQELARVCGATPAEGFFDYVYDRWAAKGLVPPREPGAATAKPPA